MPDEKKKKILLVEDDELLSETLQAMLANAGYQVKVALNGSEASSVLALEDFDLVLSDIRMPVMSGIELLHFIKKQKPTPLVFMTGFSEIADAQEAYELGAAGFLPKPFKKSELFSLLETVFGGGATAAPPEDIEDRYCPVRIDDFVTGREIQYDIYIQISSSKFVKIASGGSNLSHEQIDRFKAKGVNHLHLTKDDFRQYLGFSMDLAKKVVGAERIELKKKIRFLMQTSMETTKDLFVNEVDRDSFGRAEEAVLMSLGLVAESPDVFGMLESLRGHVDQLYAHSLAVSIYSTMIAKRIGWNSPRTIAKISMCGLFHDIGKKEIPQEILKKPRIKRTPEETKIYESHTVRGQELIDLTPGLPTEVGQVAMQHHENCQGLGYPMHLSKNRTQPVARIVALANDFCNLIIPNIDQAEPLSPSVALQKIEQGAERFDEAFLDGLRQLIVPSMSPNPAPAG